MMRTILFFVAGLITSPTFAGKTSVGYAFEAPVAAFDTKSVTVLHRGKLWKVPRGFVRAPQSLKPGQTVGVSLGDKDFKKIKIKAPPAFKR